MSKFFEKLKALDAQFEAEDGSISLHFSFGGGYRFEKGSLDPRPQTEEHLAETAADLLSCAIERYLCSYEEVFPKKSNNDREVERPTDSWIKQEYDRIMSDALDGLVVEARGPNKLEIVWITGNYDADIAIMPGAISSRSGAYRRLLEDMSIAVNKGMGELAQRKRVARDKVDEEIRKLAKMKGLL